jgi:hypothetical protein
MNNLSKEEFININNQYKPNFIIKFMFKYFAVKDFKFNK